MTSEELQEKQEKNAQLTKWLLWVCGILVSINISIVGYTASLLHELDIRLSVIEGNRWTARDGAIVFQQIAEINERLAGLPKEYPPQWLRDIVARHERRLERLEGGRN